MKHLYFLIILTMLMIMLVISCSDDKKLTNNSDVQQIPPYDTLIFNDPNDVDLSPDYKSITFYFYDSLTELIVELWEPHDSTNYPTDYMCYMYLYGTYNENITFRLHDFDIRRDNDKNGHFEETLAEGFTTWPDNKTFCIEFSKTLMPDFEIKDFWAYSMVSFDRFPDQGRFHISDSLQ